jgi:signal transduction histidine kinase
MEAASQPGKGSSFRVTLPLAKQPGPAPQEGFRP